VFRVSEQLWTLDGCISFSSYNVLLLFRNLRIVLDYSLYTRTIYFCGVVQCPKRDSVFMGAYWALDTYVGKPNLMPASFGFSGKEQNGLIFFGLKIVILTTMV
jgi:hypothetical protein